MATSTSELTVDRVTGEYRDIPIGDLVSIPNRSPGDITELAASIRTQGILLPIVVTPHPSNGGAPYTVVDGRRRFAAALDVGLLFAPCIVRDYTDERSRLEAALVANLHRKDLTPLEEASAYDRLVDGFSITQVELATRVGRSEAHISKRLSLLELPDDAQKALADGRITTTIAVELATLTKHPDHLARVLEDLPAADDEKANPDDPAWQGRADSDRAAFAFEITTAQDEIATEAARARLTEELESMGEKVLDYPPLGDVSKIKGGKWRVCRKGEEPTAYTVDRQAHAVKLTTIPLPDDKRQARGPKNGKKQPTAKELEAQEAEEALAKERDAAADRRRSTMKSILGGRKLAKDKLAEFVHYQLMATVLGGDDVYTANGAPLCELLGLQIVEHPNNYAAAQEALQKYVAHGPTEALRASAALLFDQWEEAITDQYATGLDEHLAGQQAVQNHYGFLAAHGYELTAEEVSTFEKAATEAETKKR